MFSCQLLSIFPVEAYRHINARRLENKHFRVRLNPLFHQLELFGNINIPRGQNARCQIRRPIYSEILERCTPRNDVRFELALHFDVFRELETLEEYAGAEAEVAVLPADVDVVDIYLCVFEDVDDVVFAKTAEVAGVLSSGGFTVGDRCGFDYLVDVCV